MSGRSDIVDDSKIDPGVPNLRQRDVNVVLVVAGIVTADPHHILKFNEKDLRLKICT